MLLSIESKKIAKPLLSIITAVRNGSDTLERCINSVLDQTYRPIEYIVIDAASTDGTVEILQRYRDKIDCFISEPDRGIYDAMNKGIARSSGEWIYFLGADDQFANKDVLESIFDNTGIDVRTVDIIFGNIERRGAVFRSEYGPRLKFKNTIHHQGAFYNRCLFESFRYNARFSTSSDYELNLRSFLNNAKAMRIERTIAKCDDTGVSSLGRLRGYIEEIKIRHGYIRWYESLLLDILTIGRYLFKNIAIVLLWPIRSKY